MRLVDANDSPAIRGDLELLGRVNYFIGNDPNRWQTNIPTFGKVRCWTNAVCRLPRNQRTSTRYVAGLAGSTNFPLVNPLQATYAGAGDVFIAVLNPDGSAITFSSYLGGSSADFLEKGKNVALDAEGNIYLAGRTHSADFPVLNPWQSFTESNDGFIAKLASWQAKRQGLGTRDFTLPWSW